MRDPKTGRFTGKASEPEVVEARVRREIIHVQLPADFRVEGRHPLLKLTADQLWAPSAHPDRAGWDEPTPDKAPSPEMIILVCAALALAALGLGIIAGVI